MTPAPASRAARVPAALALAAVIATGLVIAFAGGCGTRSAPAPVEPAPEMAREPRTVRTLHGDAVWYGGKWHGRQTASGERFNKHAMTAAHRSLPLGTRVRVINLENHRSVILRINDRGPYGRDRRRIIDVSEDAARRLDFHERGSVPVEIQVLEDRDTVRAREAPARSRE